MLKLVVRDLLAHLRIWLGVAVVAAATAVVGATAAGDIETAAALGGDVALALYAISGSVVVLTAVAAVIVLSSVANLTVVLQQRDHALWQLVGVRPGAVRTVVSVQLVLVALAGALVGTALSLPLLQPFFDFVFADLPGFGSLPVRFGWRGAVSVVLVVTGVVLLAGSRSAGRASRVRGMAVLADPDPPATRMGWARWCGAAVVLVALVSLVVSLRGSSLDRVEPPLTVVAPLVACLLVCVGPLVFPAVLRGWTALVPARGSASWSLARAQAVHSIGRSTAAVNPLMLAVALAGGLYAANGTVRAAAGDGGPASIALATVVLLLGGPVLLSALGSAVTIFMASGVREREGALLRASGGTGALVVATAAWEAVIYVVTAALLGAVGVLVTGAAAAWAVSAEAPGTLPSFGLGPMGVVAGAELLLVLLATVVPTLLGLRRAVASTLAAE